MMGGKDVQPSEFGNGCRRPGRRSLPFSAHTPDTSCGKEKEDPEAGDDASDRPAV